MSICCRTVFYLSRTGFEKGLPGRYFRFEFIIFNVHQNCSSARILLIFGGYSTLKYLSPLDIKFSPNGKMLAVGSHDNFIDIYQCKLAAPTLTSGVSGGLRHLKRLRGHTSYITHLDWSVDNHVIQSTCGTE
jgi:hypothetical protein